MYRKKKTKASHFCPCRQNFEDKKHWPPLPEFKNAFSAIKTCCKLFFMNAIFRGIARPSNGEKEPDIILLNRWRCSSRKS